MATMLPAFAPSEFGTIGVEFEATIIDAATSIPRPLAPTIAAMVQPAGHRGRISPELFQPILEFATGVCSSIDEVRSDLLNMWFATRPILRAEHADLLAMGLHPLAGESDMPILDDERYRDIVRRIQWPARTMHTTGVHVHVGMVSGDAALVAARRIRPLLPLLMALSASSPYREGNVTGLASTRVQIFDGVPRSGPMPDFESWREFVQAHDALHAAGAVRTPRDVWWDCRPHAEFGTLEIRVMDSVADLDDLMALCAMAWTMTVAAHDLGDFELPEFVNAENRWRAIRYGTACEFLTDEYGTTTPVNVLTERIVSTLGTTADQLGCRAELERCLHLGSGAGAHQRYAPLADTSRNHIAEALVHMRVDW